MQPQNTVQQLTVLFHPAQEDPALSVEIATLWGAFLHEGLMDSMGNPRDKNILGHWQMGCLELMQTLCQCLPWIWDELYRQWDSREVYDGIIEYDVVAALGHYLGDYLLVNHGLLPEPAEIKTLIQSLVNGFLDDPIATPSSYSQR